MAFISRAARASLIVLLTAAAGFGTTAQAASILNLSITAANGRWDAYADVEDPQSLGLSEFQYHVVGGGGLQIGTVAPEDNLLPEGVFLDTHGKFVSAGFIVFRESILLGNDARFTAGQLGGRAYNNQSASGLTDNFVHGFGKPGAPGGYVGDAFETWGFPAHLATGTYKGSGTLTVTSDSAITAFLPCNSPLHTSRTAPHRAMRCADGRPRGCC